MRATAVVLLCTGICELMTGRFDLADLIMIYLAGVVYVAFHEGLAVSVFVVISSIFLFDLIYVPPRWGLNPVNPAHFVTFAVMLAVGLLISRLAADARQQALLAEGRASRAHALADLAARLAVAVSRVQIEASLKAALQSSFGAQCALMPAGTAPEPSVATWLQLPLRGTSEPLGMLAVEPVGMHPLRAEDNNLLHAFAHQAALALERCAFEQKSVDAQVEAEAERLRSTLLSGISHDFRTPLTTIIGAVTSLMQQDHLLDAPRRAMLTQSVLDEARRLHALVSDLLDLTRMEEGAMQLSLEWCPADDLVAEALAALGTRTASHQIHVDAPADAIVWCDARLVEQALVNLVDNALRHTPHGSGVWISIRVEAAHWELAVVDDGPGLPMGRESELFRKFQRGQFEPAGAGSAGITGTGIGLGLAICAAVARLHDGRIEAFNQSGARFVLSLPQPPRDAGLAEAEQ